MNDAGKGIGPRDIFKLIYKVAMILVTLALAAGALAAYFYSTPGNGLLLVSGILAILTLMAGLSISKLDDQDARAETYRGIIDDMRARFPVSIRFSNDARGEPVPMPVPDRWGAEGAPVSVQFAEPEVHRVDGHMLDEAKRMAGEGAALDDISRMVDPEHDRHDPMHQEAFRRIVRAMIDQS